MIKEADVRCPKDWQETQMASSSAANLVEEIHIRLSDT